MITLHDVHKQGSEAVKAAVLAFGARHPRNDAAPDAEPDWDQAERHFTRLIETIMGGVALPKDSLSATVKRAENEAIHFLLSVSNLPDYRCPICIRRQNPAVSPRPTLEAT
ncbi:hypothetical protein JK364_10210 [Streptomyces sp. 110]|uniref:Uncharacterized protein n=1 Tax=Streptomyces endocoffeicus TaxID=2898945 RepID=A0ABS1PM03_9ACTN|nr:hypothetical protein [Streptomyces endocoffeicus]MBL1112766.1 hypothetical protein [Streptomyces endocoffeicus]